MVFGEVLFIGGGRIKYSAAADDQIRSGFNPGSKLGEL